MSNVFELSFLERKDKVIFCPEKMISIYYEELTIKDVYQIYITLENYHGEIQGTIHLSLLNQLLDAFKNNKEPTNADSQENVTKAYHQQAASPGRIYFKLQETKPTKEETINVHLAELQQYLQWWNQKLERLNKSAD